MYVKELILKDFRNFASLKIELGAGANIFYGDNGQGKTNLLESVYFCANGRSSRAKSDAEMIRFTKSEAHIQALVGRNGVTDRIDVHLRQSGEKGIAVNGLSVKKLGDLMQSMFVVIFSPEDLALVKGGPSERRRFMDIQLCRLSGVYYYDLQQYYRVLKQRNLLLKDIQKKKDPDERRQMQETLFIWDEQLSDFGSRIYAARRDFTRKTAEICREIHRGISGQKEELVLRYQPNVTDEEFLSKLQKNAERDMFTGATQTGIHKDELIFEINGKDARIYASQGQQRTACLSAVLSEVELIRGEKCEMPVLLLDDAFSELDAKRRVFLLSLISGIQTIITCTGLDETLAMLDIPGGTAFEVNSGGVSVTKK